MRDPRTIKKTSISGGFSLPPLMVSYTYRGFTGCLSPTYPFYFSQEPRDGVLQPVKPG